MKYSPDPFFNPDLQDHILPRTKLAPGITISKFLGGYGDQTTLKFIKTDEEKRRIARQLLLQADAMHAVSRKNEQFVKHRLTVAEGLYRSEPGETLDVDGINYRMQTGEAIVYELLDRKGNIAFEKTFDLAVYWKDNVNFEKLILDYDTYNPNGSLNLQIILVMPKIVSPWTVTYKNQVETRFNNYVASTGELVECKLQSEADMDVYSS